MEEQSAVFFRTRERFGALSNMAGGFPLLLADIPVRSTEAYYQALRFPHRPEIQEAILAEASPMFAKRRAYASLTESRPDWQQVNVALMRFSLRAKLVSHRDRMISILQETDDLPIVEKSMRDDFWGAKPDGAGRLIGQNVLGRLWMELRAELEVDPDRYAGGLGDPGIPDHTLLGREIRGVCPPGGQLQLTL